MLHHGLYEQVVNVALGDALEEIPEARKSLAPIDAAEASKVISQYMADIIKQGLEHVVDNGGDLASQVALANKIVAVIGQATEEEDFAENGIDARAEQLLAILAEKDPLLAVGKTAKQLQRPETSMAQSSLFTGAIHEPQMVTELKKKIVFAVKCVAIYWIAECRVCFT